MKCVDCDIPLSAEVTRQREDGREALVCDVCRKAHLSHVQDDDDDFMDEASANTQLSQPNVVSEGPQCKLLGCNEQAQVESGEYKEFCSKGHYKMFSMMTSTPVSPMAAASQRSPMATTGGCRNQSVLYVIHVIYGARRHAAIINSIITILFHT